MSRFSEKRLAQDLAKVVRGDDGARRRRNAAIIVFTFFGGLIGNFVFSRIEIASALWTASLIALSDLVMSLGSLVFVRGIKRVASDIGLVGLLWVLSWPFVRSEYRHQRASITEGDLSLSSSHAQGRLIEIGNSGSILDDRTDTGPVLSMFEDAGIQVENDNGHLLISTDVRDAQGKEIVKVSRNHWSVNPEKSICLDKNYTADSLEVLDGRGHVVFQIRLYPDHLQLQGEWYNDFGKGVELLGDRTGSEVIRWENQTERSLKEKMLSPLFMYPSYQHWAEWAKPTSFH